VSLVLVQPSNLGIRGTDDYGSGAFGAARAKHSAGAEEHAILKYAHKGADWIVVPGDVIPAPAHVRQTLYGLAYAEDNRFHSIHLELIEDPHWQIKLLYAWNTAHLLQEFQAGQPLAIAEDISLRYKNITRHVHLEVRHMGMLVDPMTLLAVSA